MSLSGGRCFFAFFLVEKGNVEHFRVLWKESIAAAAEQSLRLVAVSFPDLGADTGPTIVTMNNIMGIDGSAEERGLGEWESMEGGGAATGGRAPRALNVWQVVYVDRSGRVEVWRCCVGRRMS